MPTMHSHANDGALVLLSGGQDSATCVAWALERFERVETIGFDYGQRHRVELTCRLDFRAQLAQAFPSWGARLGEDHLVDLSLLSQISDTAMTQEIAIRSREDGLPNTFVPGRNLLFMTVAAALAYRRGLRTLVGGMCETDFSGYPDCRDDTLKALQVALNLGMDRRFILETPLMWIDKAATWQLAETLGGVALVDLVRETTHTCYLGDRSQRHDWGYGCGSCPACELRARGYAAYRAHRAHRAYGTSRDDGTETRGAAQNEARVETRREGSGEARGQAPDAAPGNDAATRGRAT